MSSADAKAMWAEFPGSALRAATLVYQRGGFERRNRPRATQSMVGQATKLALVPMVKIAAAR
jgi:hypothetical protein